MLSPKATAKLRLILTASLCASLLAACAVSTPSADAGINLTALPARVTHCNAPVRTIGATDVEGLWKRDRASLVTCKANLDAVVGHYENLERTLSAADKTR